jgi:glycosyltransferase involved in cell wall biosynthesis
MPKISIIIPNFNHQDFLNQRIESVLNQTFQDYEVILLDDASTDDSRGILNSYAKHPKVSQVLFNKSNSGSVFCQWIKGIQLAKGDYIWIAESDDYADSRFLETSILQFETTESLGIVFTDTNKVDSEGNSLGLVSQSKNILGNLLEEGGIINKSNLSKYLLRKMVIVNASSVLFKKEALLNLDFDALKTFKNTGDVFVYIGIALNYGLLFLPEPLNFMRLHSDNTTKSNKNNGQIYRDKLFMFDYYLKDFRNLKIRKEDVVYFLKSNMFFFIDYGNIYKIKTILKNMVNFGFISRKDQLKMNAIVVSYSKFTYNVKPHSVRIFFKYFLNKV